MCFPIGGKILNMFNADDYGESANDYIMPVPTHQFLRNWN